MKRKPSSATAAVRRFARVLLALGAITLAACPGSDAGTNCTLSYGPVPGDGLGFEVIHTAPVGCPIGVPPSGGKEYQFSAIVKMNPGFHDPDVFNGAVRLIIYNPNNSLVALNWYTWTMGVDGKEFSSVFQQYQAGTAGAIFGVNQEDRAYTSVKLMSFDTVQALIHLKYVTEQVRVTSNDPYVGSRFTATVDPVGSPPAYPLTYEWQLDGSTVGSSQTYETFFNDTYGHFLEAIVTDALGRVERTGINVWPLNPGNCESPPCGH